mgnify:CR=1 FL=1
MNQPISSGGLTPPLRAARDMAPVWRSTDELSFDDAAEILVRAHEEDGRVEDRPLLDLRSWAVVPHRGHFALRSLASSGEPVMLRATALSSLAARFGAPGEFIRDKLPAELQLALLNYLLAVQDKPHPVLLRLRGGEVTALVSERYATLSPGQFVEGIRTALRHQGLLGEVRVRAIATGTTDALRLVFHSDRHELKVGDVTQVGLDVSTSCFGKSAVHVTGVLYRLVCMNGLRVPEKMGRFSFRHIGETERIQAALRDAVPTALFHARDFLNYWQNALVTHIHGVADTIDRMRLLTQGERTLVGSELKKEEGVKALPARTSAYNLVNALTSAAQQAEPARRLELESFAGEFLLREVTR